MSELFTSGLVADLILLILVIEGAAIAVYRRRTGRGPGLSAVLPFLAAGACFALALRGALVGASWPWIAAALTGALLAHAVDVHRRGTGTPSPGFRRGS